MWSDVADALAAFSEAYHAVLAARVELREGSKKRNAAEERFIAAHEARKNVLLQHWTEEDGYYKPLDGSEKQKSLGHTLQRYYHETASPTKGVKRG